MRLTVRNQTPEEAAALAAERGMTLGQYLRSGGAPAMVEPAFVLGDRCRKCLHWFWPVDGKWHSLIPIELADDPEAGDYTCVCPVCAS